MAETAHRTGNAWAADTSAPLAVEAAPRVAPEPVLLPGDRLARPAGGFWGDSFRRLLGNRLAMAALIGLMVLCALAFLAPVIAQVRGLDRDAMELLNNYQRPNARHWFGTDEYGRDYFIRTLYGGQVSIFMGLAVTAVVLVIAIPVGLLAGYYGGLIDDVFNWIVQIRVTVPVLFVLILIAAWIPPTPLSLVLIISSVSWTDEARQARGLTFQLKRTDYVLAARALGARNGRIMFRHILPNIISLMIVLASFQVIGGIVAETGLSFLGLGIRPPIPSWGNMLTNSLNYMYKAPHLIVFPGLAVGLIVLCTYMFADGLRDAFDPRLKE